MTKSKVARHTTNEVDDAIFSPRPKPNKISTSSLSYYTMSGEEGGKLDGDGNTTIAADSLYIYAKTDISNNTVRYLIKSDNTGFINPNGLYSNKSKINKNTNGIVQYKFVEVSKPVFGLYLTFLKTKNEAYLKHANRENF